jgi:hypothetical protein
MAHVRVQDGRVQARLLLASAAASSAASTPTSTDTTRRARAICATARPTRRACSICEARRRQPATSSCARKPRTRRAAVALARADAWVAAEDDQWFAASDNDRIDLLPEKKRYEPGATARFQVRMPFKEATVLVTLEREGVLDAFVKTVSRADPVLEVPMKGAYAPNVFVSAFLVRGRVGDVAPTALVDLGKPAFKMGLTQLRVGWSAHELAVKVTPAQPVYKVREKVTATIAVRRPDGSAPPKGSEVALARSTKACSSCCPTIRGKLLDAMMAERGEEVETSTAQMQVIGKRHFGRKALVPGGGGGRSTARELFDTLCLWRARVPLDDNGNATVEIPLNDSLTSFRIVAVASSGAQLFGTGETSIRVTQDVMVLSGCRRWCARATSSARRSRCATRASAADSLACGTMAGTALPPQNATLAPGRRASSTGTSTVSADRDERRVGRQGDRRRQGSADVAKGGAEGRARGAGAHVPGDDLPAHAAAIDRGAAARDAIPGRGGVNVQMQAKLAGELPGVRDWLLAYPYSCFEQRASGAIGLQRPRAVGNVDGSLPDYLDRDGLLKYWPIMRDGDDVLTSYVLSIASEAGYAIPDNERNRMEQALIGFVEGRIVRYSALPTADLAIRKVAASRRCRGAPSRSTRNGSRASPSSPISGRRRR